MSLVTVLGALVGAAVFVGSGLVVAVTVTRRAFRSWRGSLALTTAALVWLSWAMGLGQLLGAVGLLRRMALLAGAVLSAALAVAFSRWRPDPARGAGAAVPAEPGLAAGVAEAAGRRDRPTLTVLTGLLVSVVAALWIFRTVIALHRGIMDPDSLGYHLPFAVTFAHSGYADQHRLLIPLLPVQFFPANDELLSAMALAITHTLAFAAVKNLLYGALVLVAAHALGRAFGAGRVTVAATAIVLGVPVFAFSQPGEAVNDTVMLLLFVGGLAVLANTRDGPARSRPAAYVLALACSGLMLGVKYSGIVPATALAVLAVVLLMARVPNRRWQWAGAGLLSSAAMGGSWYLRNAIQYGNPIPTVRLALGPVHLPTVPGADAAIAYSVAHYALHGQLLDVFYRGLSRGLGPLYLFLVLLFLVGTVTAIASGDRFRLGLSAIAAAGLIGYVFTPAGAYGPPSSVPLSFVINLHYAVPALVAGALAGAVALARRRWAWILPALGLIAVTAGIDRGRGIATWAPETGGTALLLLMVAVLVAGAASVAWQRPSGQGWALAGAVTATAVGLMALAMIAVDYPSQEGTDPVVSWAATVPGARIAVWVGNVADLYGPQAQNQVVIMSQVVDGAAQPIATCRAWKQALVDSRAQYTAVIGGTEWFRWLEADPAFQEVANEAAGATPAELRNLQVYTTVVFQNVGRPDMSCLGQA